MKTNGITFIDAHPGVTSLREEVRAGLGRDPKRLSPKLFYDQRGSELFDAICDLPEYYPTRAEIAILEEHAGAISLRAADEVMLIELGSGASRKIHHLLQALSPAAYMAVDISREFLLQECHKLASDYPQVDVYALCADLCEPLELNGYGGAHARRVAYFPGSSIGNFEPGEAKAFLQNLHTALDAGDALLVGVDLKKDPDVLHAAYNDSQGVTAAFNLNMLERIARELDTDIDPALFRHEAFYAEDEGRVEMHLVCEQGHDVTLEGERIRFEAGESIHTECSYKYSIDEFQSLARQASFTAEDVWTDDEDLFSLHYLTIAA
jgi:dimethylhistidine N-methyltransferase